MQAVRDALRAFLWPLMPGGAGGGGWELAGVRDRELEVVVARVPGVLSVTGVNLFGTIDGKAPADISQWQAIKPVQANAPADLVLQPWQRPKCWRSW